MENIYLLVALAILATAAGISQTLTLSWARNGESIAQTATFTDEGEINYDFTITGGATDSHKVVEFAVDEVVELYILSTRDIQIETNATDATGGDTVQIKANLPFIWYDGIGYDLADVLTNDVTDMYFTLAAGADATVKIRGMKNATP